MVVLTLLAVPIGMFNEFIQLGVLLIIGGFGYLIDVFAEFLFSGSNLSIGLFTGLSEILFLLWLLIKGVNVEKWKVAESKRI